MLSVNLQHCLGETAPLMTVAVIVDVYSAWCFKSLGENLQLTGGFSGDLRTVLTQTIKAVRLLLLCASNHVLYCAVVRLFKEI